MRYFADIMLQKNILDPNRAVLLLIIFREKIKIPIILRNV